MIKFSNGQINENVTIFVVFTLIFKRKKKRDILSCWESYILNTKKKKKKKKTTVFIWIKHFFFLQCKNNESWGFPLLLV